MTSRLRHRRVVGLVVAATALSMAIPIAGAQARSDQNDPSFQNAAPVAVTPVQAAPRVDPRSPDARDAARGSVTASGSVAPTPAAAPTTTTITEHSSPTLAIVFSACALLIALLAVGFVAVSRRPRPRWNTP